MTNHIYILMEFYQRLAFAIEQAKENNHIESLSDLSKKVGAPAPSSIDSIIKEKRKSSKYTSALARGLKVRVEWLAEGIEPMLPEDMGQLIAYDNLDEIAHLDTVNIPFFVDFKMAAGDGVNNSEFVSTVSMPFYLNSLNKAGVKDPSKCFVGQVKGDSNAPYIPNGATVGIDAGFTRIVSNEFYLITISGEERLKQIIETKNGNGIVLHSHNEDKDSYPDQHFSYKEMAENSIVVRGRMFWCSWLKPL